MRKNLIFIIAIVILIMQTGCTSAGSEVVLESAVEASDTVSESDEAAQDLSCVSAGEGSFAEETEEVSVVVYVCGAVTEPGVYELPTGSRLDDAVKAAGGFDEEADETYVNLAAVCGDGIKLYIPTKQEVAEAGAGSGAGVAGLPETYGSEGSDSGALGVAADNGLVNINTASKDELTGLPGIGAGYADRIIAYRNEKGPFKSVEDIMKVSGIKEKLFSKIKDQITV